MNQELLTRSECNALRGLAIIGIFLHNFCHWLGPVVKENEYQFIQGNVDWLSRVVASPDALLPVHLLSFFGHYGVPVFLFLSAYGLERKYGQLQQAGPRGPAFVRYHFLKLFKMMIVGFICFTIVDQLTRGSWHYTLLQVVAQLGMFNNLLPDPDRNIWPGPYWFFGLMLQLYIVYRLLLFRRHWGYTVGLMVGCVGVQLLMDPAGETINWYRYNFMGGMLPFGFGLLAARFGGRIRQERMSLTTLLAFLLLTSAMVVAFSYSFLGWAFAPVAVCAASAALVKLIVRMPFPPLSHGLMYVLEWMGAVSAALFVIHPVLRKIFIPISRQGDVYTGLLLYVIASVGAAWLIRELMNRIPNPKMK